MITKKLTDIVKKKIIERKSAYESGFRNSIVPLYYEFYPWLEIAEKYNLFPLSSQPFTNIAYCDEGDGLKKYNEELDEKLFDLRSELLYRLENL